MSSSTDQNPQFDDSKSPVRPAQDADAADAATAATGNRSQPAGLKTEPAGLKTEPAGLKSHPAGLSVDLLEEFFTLDKGKIYWKQQPYRGNPAMVGDEAGYQSVTKVGARRYKGNIFICLHNVRLTAQEVAWVLHHGVFPPSDMRIIHLDGDRANNSPENLHLQPKAGTED